MSNKISIKTDLLRVELVSQLKVQTSLSIKINKYETIEDGIIDQLRNDDYQRVTQAITYAGETEAVCIFELKILKYICKNIQDEVYVSHVILDVKYLRYK